MKRTYNTFCSETNAQLSPKCRSNSLLHYYASNNKHNNKKIKLDLLTDYIGNADMRSNIPIGHIKDSACKVDYIEEQLTTDSALNKADHQSQIRDFIKTQKYQLLLEKDKAITEMCIDQNKIIKSELDKRKLFLKNSLTKLIKSSLLYAKKNSPINSMLPKDIDEIIQYAKNETNEGDPFNLNQSAISKTSLNSGNESKRKKDKNEFLSLLGVDVENLSSSNVNIDIDKAWDFVSRWARGRNVDEILRYKVVNSIMSICERKASEKVKKVYEKLNIYREIMRKKKREEIRKKKEEERKRLEELRNKNPRELIRQRMATSVSKPQKFETSLSNKKAYRKKKKHLTEKKPIIKYDAYKDVDLILGFIDNSARNSNSKLSRVHYANIKTMKNMDQNLEKMMMYNGIFYK